MSAAATLQKAIFQRLTGDPALTALLGPAGVHDMLANGRGLPAVVIGEMVSDDRSTATEAGEEHLLTLEVWSDSGRKQARLLAGHVERLLHDAALTLEGHHLVLLLLRRSRTRRKAGQNLHAIDMEFRAVTERMSGA